MKKDWILLLMLGKKLLISFYLLVSLTINFTTLPSYGCSTDDENLLPMENRLRHLIPFGYERLIVEPSQDLHTLIDVIQKGMRSKEMPKELEILVQRVFKDHHEQRFYIQGLLRADHREALTAFKNASKFSQSISMEYSHLAKELCSEEERSLDLEEFTKAGNKMAENILDAALNNRLLGNQSSQFPSDQDRFEELKRRANQGKGTAASYVNHALFSGSLGQSNRLEEERFQELKERANGGDLSAAEYVNDSLYKGKLGQGSRSKQSRFNEIAERASQEDKYAAELLNQILYKGDFCQDFLSPDQRFERLQMQAAQNLGRAKAWVIKAIVKGKVNQQPRSEEERWQELEERAFKGDQEAAQWVVRALINDKTCPQEERIQKLLKLAAIEGLNVRYEIIDAIYSGKLSNKDEDNRVMLHSFASQGDPNALDRVYCAIRDGKFGQDQYPREARYNKLKALTRSGDRIAARQFYLFFYQQYFIQFIRDRMNDVITGACEGDEEAYDLVQSIGENVPHLKNLNFKILFKILYLLIPRKVSPHEGWFRYKNEGWPVRTFPQRDKDISRIL